MIKRKIIMPYVSISYSHKKSELNKTLLAIKESLLVYKKALESDVKNYLKGAKILPVFRRFN